MWKRVGVGGARWDGKRGVGVYWEGEVSAPLRDCFSMIKGDWLRMVCYVATFTTSPFFSKDYWQISSKFSATLQT